MKMLKVLMMLVLASCMSAAVAAEYGKDDMKKDEMKKDDAMKH